MFKFLRLCFKNEFKDYLIVIGAFSLFLSFEYMIWCLFFCVYDRFISFEEKMFFHFSTLALMVIVFMMTLFINHFFTNTKRKEFSLILITGRRIIDILTFLVMQYGAIFVISNIMAIVMGKMMLVTITDYVFWQYHIVLQYSYVYSLGMFFLIDGIIFIYIMLMNFGMFFRMETKIISLMSNINPRLQRLFIDRILNKDRQKKVWIEKYEKFIKTLEHLCILLIMIISLIGIFTAEELNKKIFSYVLSIISLMAFVYMTIPYLFDILHRQFLKSVVLLVSCSNIIYMIKSLIFIINLNSILIPIIISFLVLFTVGKITQIYMVIYIAIVIIILFMSMIFKITLLIEAKYEEQQILKVLGINDRQLRLVQKLELNIFYFLAVIIPMMFSFLLLYSGVYHHMIAINFANMVVGEYVIGAILSYYIIYRQYRKIYRRDGFPWVRKY